jgi:hypothetical protein
MLTGKPPFWGQTAAIIMTKHLNEAPEPIEKYVKDIRKDVLKVIDKMMSKRRGDRYKSAKELLDDLRALAKGKPLVHIRPAGSGSVHMRRQTAGHRPVKQSGHAGKKHKGKRHIRTAKKNSSAMPLIIVVLIIAAAVGYFVYNETKNKKPEKIPEEVKIIKTKLPAEPPAKKTKPKPKPKSKTKVKASKRRVVKTRPKKKNRADVVLAAYKKMEEELKTTPEVARSELLKEFASKFPNTELGKKAKKRAEKLESSQEEAQEKLVEDLAMENLRKLPTLGNENYMEAYNEFIYQYKGTKAARKARETLDDYLAGRYQNNDTNLVETIIDPNNTVAALETLKNIANGDAKTSPESLRPFLSHEESKIRAQAIKAMVRVNRGEGYDAAVKAIDNDKSARVRGNALEALAGFISSEEVRNKIKEVAKNDKNSKVRAKAKELLK